jgi:uncharacterized protein RhaS with RHS repeats
MSPSGLPVDRRSWQVPVGTTVTDPLGATSAIGVTSRFGRPFVESISQAAGAGSGSSASLTSHDVNANVASRDDFNGTRSCYLNDLARNLKVASVSGLSQSQACAAVTPANAALPAGALKTSTQWHPDWSLPIKVAAPNQITTNVYNGQPDSLNGNVPESCAPAGATLPNGLPIAVLCKQVEQATTDADGHSGFDATLQSGVAAVVVTWTYNLDGQVLTTTNAGSGTTIFAYYGETNAEHQRGDLKSITSSLGKVTTFDRYNRFGQVLQSTDARGIVAVNTYDLRQRLLTNTVGSETTAYAYDGVGQLKKVSFDNGTWVGFDYDDAHRQVAAYDNKANRIDYVLDNAGNQTDQHVKDPSGALKRGLARVMDVLGRAQQSTGRE